MKTLIYLIQVSACTGIFYLFYHAVLSRLTFFSLNRWYLLATLGLSFVIPLITIPDSTIPEIYTARPDPFQPVRQMQVFMDPATNISGSDSSFESVQWLTFVSQLYFAVAGALALYLLVRIGVLLNRIRVQKSQKIGAVSIIRGGEGIKNGSFFNFIFINETQLSAVEAEQVIAHELVHFERRHSIDKLIFHVSQIVLWFNPFIYAYLNAVDANHEYEVDYHVSQRTDKDLYACLIVKLAMPGSGILYHHFSRFPLRRRVAFIFTQPSKDMKKLLYILVLPLILAGGLFFSNREAFASPAAFIEAANLLPDNSAGIQNTAVEKVKPSIVEQATVALTAKSEVTESNVSVVVPDEKGPVASVVPNAAVSKREVITIQVPAQDPLYIRMVVYNDDGSIFNDSVVVRRKGHLWGGSYLAHNATVGVFVEGKLLSEADFVKLDESKMRELQAGSSISVSSADFYRLPGEDLSPYDMIFNINYARHFEFSPKPENKLIRKLN